MNEDLGRYLNDLGAFFAAQGEKKRAAWQQVDQIKRQPIGGPTPQFNTMPVEPGGMTMPGLEPEPVETPGQRYWKQFKGLGQQPARRPQPRQWNDPAMRARFPLPGR